MIELLSAVEDAFDARGDLRPRRRLGRIVASVPEIPKEPV
jgi:hypothetical protein